MNVALCIVSDRGDRYLPKCLLAAAKNLRWDFSDSILINDSEHRLGLAGAVQAAWDRSSTADYILHLEEDFVLTEPVDIEAMLTVLEAEPHLAQLVLKRQPWNPEETAAGGIIEQHPSDYNDRVTRGWHWVEHSRVFSLNPCLVPRRVLDLGWPNGNEAEFTHRCIANGYRFGFWGRRTDSPRCQHIGVERGNGWKL